MEIEIDSIIKMQHYILKKDRFSSHSFISDVVKTEGPERILDIGCSEGLISRALGEIWRDKIWGIDINKPAAKKAKPYYRKVWVMDIEREMPKVVQKFDCLLFGDVLEHLKDPWGILKKFTDKLLIEGGLVIISLPNAVNWYMRCQLALGNFVYRDRGLMDKTHLRFFTFKSARRMIDESGLLVKKECVSPIPLPLVWKNMDAGKPLHWIHGLNNFITNLWPGFFGYQLLFVCRKNKK